MGIDSCAVPHGRNLEERSLMVTHSLMVPLDAWVAATWSAAVLCGIDQQIGRVAPGFFVDLALVEGGVLDQDDLAVRIRGVWKDEVARL